MTGYDIVTEWAKTLAADAEFNAWVAATFGRDLLIMVGYDEVREFGRQDAPYVVMHPAADVRGPQAEELEFDIVLFFGVDAPGKPENVGGVLTERALYLMENQLCPRVLRALRHTSCPPLTGEGQTSPVRDGYCERDVLVHYSEGNALGIGADAWS